MGTDRARNLRRRMSLPEATLWNALRAEPFAAFHFRRQAQLGPFYADFVSHRVKLVIEVDGSQHFTDHEIAYDARRDAFLRGQGYRILRVTTLDVLTNLHGVSTAILALLPHPPSQRPVPSPQGGREKEEPAISQSGIPPPCGEGGPCAAWWVGVGSR